MKPALRIALLASVALFAGAAHADHAIKVAVIEPLSGPLAGNGTDVLERFRYLFDAINARGGVDGHRFEVFGYDNGFDVEKTAQQMRRAADEGVSFVIHGIGPQHADAIRNFIIKHNRRNPESEMAYLAHSSGSNDLSNSKCMFFQAMFDPTVDMKVAAMVDSLVATRRGTRAFLINPNYELGKTVEDAMKRMLAEKAPGIELAGSELVAPFGQVQDFTPIIARIKAAGADLVMTSNFGPDLIRLVSAAADSGLDAQITTLYGLDPSAMGAIGKDRMDKMKVSVVTEYHENDTGNVARLEELNKAFLDVTKTSWGIDRYRFLTDMLVAAIDKADSAKPRDVMKALEGATVMTAGGEAVMRPEDHQLIQPYFFVEVDPNAKLPLQWKGTDIGFAFKTLRVVGKDTMALPTTCKMDRE